MAAAYYELLIALHAQEAQLDEPSKATVHASLLRGLSDPDDAPAEAGGAGDAEEAQPGRYDADTGLLRPPLRAAMAHYWHTARLPAELPPRLLACFTTLYSAPTEMEWVQAACDVLLRVAADGAASAPHPKPRRPCGLARLPRTPHAQHINMHTHTHTHTHMHMPTHMHMHMHPPARPAGRPPACAPRGSTRV